ncbi:fatty acyl-AMP ligase [Planomonospora sp. ID67723]|uniref:fatty acyl-AMP ligase n=1 Tax=Planomonospora sp. ID67723 TaxID=2738134 RepID=UPI0018C43071|nr:fatty acyl-AMP ligase [Planomonospora sp. ID67723]MBG0831306.1 fatty acyl-AMP ligase [Planomonospora sp. ID67723]
MTSFRPSTLVDIIRHRAHESGGGKAYLFPTDASSGELTYRELERRARALAVGLRQMAEPGDRVLVMCSPGAHFVVAFAASLYAGLIAVPVYPPTNSRSLSRLLGIVDDASPSVLLADAPVLALVSAQAGEGPLRGLRQVAVEDFAFAADEELTGPLPVPGDIAFLQYTSGSTGDPKGVVVTHGNLMHNSSVIASRMGVTEESVCVSWLPPYHDMGLVGGILQPLYRGFPAVLMTPLDFLQRPLHWLELISQYGATVSGGPDFAFELCVRRFQEGTTAPLDLSTWSIAFSGSEPIRKRTFDQFAACFASSGFRPEAWYPCYGMAETTLFISGGPAGAPTVTARTSVRSLEERSFEPDEAGDTWLVGCGGPAPELDVRIVDTSTFEPLPDGRIGEIVVAGESVAAGYWNDKGQEAFQTRLPGVTGDFLRTGDLGFLWQGQLFVTGRVKDVLIIRGRNHYPQDIEDCVTRAHPTVRPRGVAAFTVEVDGSEQLVVVAELSPSHDPARIEEVRSAIRQAVAEEHGLSLHAVTLVRSRSVPKTSNGKLQRGLCRRLFLEEKLPVLPVAQAGEDVA